MTIYKACCRQLLKIPLLLLVSFSSAAPIELPEIGDRSSSIISLQEEAKLGQSWLHAYYSSSPVERDYLLHEYLNTLTNSLIEHSDLRNRHLHILLVENLSLNAFSVPGGIIGIHSGLLLHAKTEDELASVISHEISHLSQRHFVRSIDNQKGNTLKVLVGMLASIALAATVGSDAGIAALSLVQGLSIDQKLHYSRQSEQEADRLGMQILLRANRDPNAVPSMFDRMMRLTHYAGFKPPEYLLTHPLPESRITDAELRVIQYPKRYYRKNDYYDIMRIHARLKAAGTPHDALREFQLEVDKQPESKPFLYGLAHSYLDTHRMAEAKPIAEKLFTLEPTNPAFRALRIEVANAEKDYKTSLALAEDYLRLNPYSYAVGMLYADTLKQDKQFDESIRQLEKLIELQADNPTIWYELAENAGLGSDFFKLHRARAEYFILTGFYQQAIKHLRYARGIVKDDYIERSALDERIKEVLNLSKQSTKFR